MPHDRCGCYYEPGKAVLHTVSCILAASTQIEARDTNWRNHMEEKAQDAAPTEGAVAPDSQPTEGAVAYPATESDDQDAQEQVAAEEQVDREAESDDSSATVAE